MSSLYKRANGVYYLSYFDSTRTPKRLTVSTRTTIKREAERVRLRLDSAYLHREYDPWRDDPRTLEARDAPPPPPPAEPSTLALGAAVVRFLATRANLSPFTRERYRSILERLAAHVGEATRVRSVTTADVQGFIEATETKPVTRHNYRRAIRTLFLWLHERGEVEGDPTLGTRLERAPQKHPRFLSREEVSKVARAIEARQEVSHVENGTGLWLLPVVLVNVYLGLRAGEVVHVRWSDVDLDRRTLTVRNTDTFTTKAGKERTLPLCGPVLDVLGKLERRSEFVFPNHGGTQLHRQYLSRAFKHFSGIL